MAQQVVFQGRFHSERFPALITGKWLRGFQLLVALEVVLKRLFFSVRPLAARTGKGQRRFAGFVAQKMVLQRLLFSETFATLVTGKTLLVGFHVFLQFTFAVKRDETLVAGQVCVSSFLLSAI